MGSEMCIRDSQYTSTVGLWLLLDFPACAGTPPSPRAATPSPSESSDDDGTAALPAAPVVVCSCTPPDLVPRVGGWSSSQAAHREQGPVPIRSPVKLHRSVLSFHLECLQAPGDQPRLQCSLWVNVFHVMYYWSPTGRDKAERPREHHTQA